MSTDQEQVKDDKESQRNLPGIDSNRPSHEPGKGVAGDLSPDDEVIDLVDIIMKGDDDPEDMAPLPGKEDASTGASFMTEKAEEDSSESPNALEEESAEDQDDTYELFDFDFDTPVDLEEPDSYALTALPEDDLAEVVAGLNEGGQADEPGSGAVSDRLPAISTERLEKIITEAVKDVVERVTRETMSEVAEKIIKEAIEGLRQSLPVEIPLILTE